MSGAAPEQDPVEPVLEAAPAKEQGGFVPGMGLPRSWGWAGAEESLDLTVSAPPESFGNYRLERIRGKL